MDKASKLLEIYLSWVRLRMNDNIGLWNFEEGLKMRTDQILFPVWRGKLTLTTEDLQKLLDDQ
jgi:hypothetical protein